MDAVVTRVTDHADNLAPTTILVLCGPDDATHRIGFAEKLLG